MELESKHLTDPAVVNEFKGLLNIDCVPFVQETAYDEDSIDHPQIRFDRIRNRCEATLRKSTHTGVR
jgi:hypothetical protein